MPLIADSIRNLSASLTVMAIVIAGLLLGRDVLIPLALATLLAFDSAPIVRALVARRVPRGLSVTAVMISVVIIIVGASALFSAQMLSLTAELGTYKANLVEKARTLSGSGSTEGVIKRAVDSVDALEKEIKREWSRSQSQPGRESREECSRRRHQGERVGRLLEQCSCRRRAFGASGIDVLVHAVSAVAA